MKVIERILQMKITHKKAITKEINHNKQNFKNMEVIFRVRIIGD